METTTFIVQMAKCTECLDEMTDKRNKEQQTNPDHSICSMTSSFVNKSVLIFI